MSSYRFSFISLTLGLSLVAALALNVPYTLGIAISPIRIVNTVAAGNEQTIRLKITNDENTPGFFTPAVWGVTQDPLTGRPRFGLGTDEAEQWILKKTQRLSLAPHETAEAEFIIKVPTHIPSGSHYVGLGVGREAAAGSALTGQVMSLVILQVAGVLNESLRIVRFEPDHIYTTQKKWLLELQTINEGNVEIPLDGKLIVTDWRKKEILSQPLSLGNQLLPKTSRLTTTMVASNMFLFPGKYHLAAQINYGRTGQLALKETTLWYMPWWGILGLIISLGGVSFGIYTFFFKKR